MNGRKVRPPLFAHTVRVTSVEESAGGEDYFNFSLSPADGKVADSLQEPGSPALEAAKAVADMVKSGIARAAHESMDGGAGGERDDDDLPF